MFGATHQSNFYPANKEGGSARGAVSNFSAGRAGVFQLWSDSDSNVDLFMSRTKCTNYYIEFYVLQPIFALTSVRIWFDWITFDIWINSRDYAASVSILLKVGSVYENLDVRTAWLQYVGDDCFREAMRKWCKVLWSHANVFTIHLVVNNPSLLIGTFLLKEMRWPEFPSKLNYYVVLTNQDKQHLHMWQ